MNADTGGWRLPVINVMVIAQDNGLTDALCSCIAQDPSLRLAARCHSGAEAIIRAIDERPDVIALDMQLPGVSNTGMFAELRNVCNAAVVAMSVITGIALQTLDAGAADFLYMPVAGSESDHSQFVADAIVRFKTAFFDREAAGMGMPASGLQPVRLIVIYCSGGGPVPLSHLLCRLPKDGPAVLAVQRHSGAFDSNFTGLLSEMCCREILPAADAMELKHGCVCVMDALQFAGMEEADGALLLKLRDSSVLPGRCSGVDALFQSVADVLGTGVVGVLLSCRGEGEAGLRYMAAHGALAIILNKNALLREIDYETPAGMTELPLEDIAGEILVRIKGA